MKLLTKTIIGGFIVLVTGCQMPEMTIPSTYTPERAPNYNLPLADFQKGDFNILASEFRDQYSGQYVVFEGTFMMTEDQVLLPPVAGSPKRSLYAGLRSVTVTNYTNKLLKVIWSDQDKDLGRPLVSVGLNSPLRIYAYILPAGHTWRLKSRNDVYQRGFGEIVPILIKVEPL